MRSTKMIISESALYENALAIRRAIPEKLRLMCVVKANAYGHGAVQAARAMLRAGADAFAVAIVEEAQELRRAGRASARRFLRMHPRPSIRRKCCARWKLRPKPWAGAPKRT